MNYNVVIVSIKENDYRIHFQSMSKGDAINRMNNSNLNEKSRLLQIFLLYIKRSETTYYQRNREKKLNKANDYYKKLKKKY